MDRWLGNREVGLVVMDEAAAQRPYMSPWVPLEPNVCVRLRSMQMQVYMLYIVCVCLCTDFCGDLKTNNCKEWSGCMYECIG